jgi:hypothetical protein
MTSSFLRCGLLLLLSCELCAAQAFSGAGAPAPATPVPSNDKVIDEISPQVFERLARERRQREAQAVTPAVAPAEPTSAPPSVTSTLQPAPPCCEMSASLSVPPPPSTASVSKASVPDALREREQLAEVTELTCSSQLNPLLPDPMLTSSKRYQEAYLMYGKPAKFPYTASDKFHLFIRDIYDPFGLTGEGFQALYNQATGQPREYGGGMDGYGKRFGAVVGTDVAGEFFGTWLFPSIMRTDPRYFRMARGNVGKRAVYALTRVLITKKDSGGNTFNWANFMAGFATTSISNLYYPHRDRDLTPTLEHATINIGYDALYAMFREFWPDVAHRLHIPAFVIRRTADPVFPKSESTPAVTPGG